MIHGQLMYRFLRGSFSESELSLSYNAHSRKHADTINRLRDQPFEQGMIIYIYIYIYMHIDASYIERLITIRHFTILYGIDKYTGAYIYIHI